MLAGLLLLWLPGCMATFGPSQERMACLNLCANDKDACMLAARNAGEIRWCDADHRTCCQGCPR